MPAVTIRPQDGGKLITRAASADAGIANLTVKSNWRRDLSDEIRREGHDYFLPIGESETGGQYDYQSQPFPGDATQEINLIHMIRRPNGDAAVIAGTDTTLWRFLASTDGYVESAAQRAARLNEPAGEEYVVAGYWEQATSRWQIIGNGFSTSGRRWEVLDIDGTTIFNNGVDLPQAMRVEWRFVRPLHELREQGVVCVGTIAEHNGIAFLGDVTELNDDGVAHVLDLINSGEVTVSQEGYRKSGTVYATSDGEIVTASAAFFEAGDVGRQLVWSDGRRLEILEFTDSTHVVAEPHDAATVGRSFRITDKFNATNRHAYLVEASGDFFEAYMAGMTLGWPDGTARKVVEYISPTQVLVDVDTPVAAGRVSLENPVTYTMSRATIEDKYVQRRQYRVIRSELGQPTRYGTQVPVMTSNGSSVLTTTRPTRSFAQLDTVAVLGGAANGGVLAADPAGNQVKIVSLAPGSIKLSTYAQQDNANGVMQRLASIGGVQGFDDLQGDGSTILKMRTLQSRLVVYKDTDIFIGRYTGVAGNPVLYEQVKVPHGRSLYYRNTLVEIGGQFHVFAGKRQFYQFNLTSRIPEPIPDADLVSNIFYDFASLDDTEQIFAADNHLTQEIWIVCPANTATPVLAYDYTYRTFSTVDFGITAAATIKEATQDIREDLGDWFLMGTSYGAILQYGLEAQPTSRWATPGNPTQPSPAIYYRRHARPFSTAKEGYQSILASGMMHFGDAFNEKHLRSYVVQFSSLQKLTPTLHVALYSARNQSDHEYLIGQALIEDADGHGLIPVHSIAHFFRDEIRITGADNPARIHMRTFEVKGINSRSFHKQ